MLLLPEFERRRQAARHSLDQAASDNVVELCQQYLALLAEYRAELYRLPSTLGLYQWPGAFIWEDLCNIRKSIRAAIEDVTRERNETGALLLSFTSISGYEAVETLNRRKYQGHADWELRAGRVARYAGDHGGETMTVLEAVGLASLLRREEHAAIRAAMRVRASEELHVDSL